MEEGTSDTQFGFRNRFGSRDTFFSFNILIQRCFDNNKEVDGCFIDYEKTFDKVRHGKLMQILKGMQMIYRDVKILKLSKPDS